MVSLFADGGKQTGVVFSALPVALLVSGHLVRCLRRGPVVPDRQQALSALPTSVSCQAMRGVSLS